MNQKEFLDIFMDIAQNIKFKSIFKKLSKSFIENHINSIYYSIKNYNNLFFSFFDAIYLEFYVFKYF